MVTAAAVVLPVPPGALVVDADVAGLGGAIRVVVAVTGGAGWPAQSGGFGAKNAASEPANGSAVAGGGKPPDGT